MLSSPLNKTDLQQLLTRLENQAASSSGQRTARAWAWAAGLADQRGVTTVGRLVITKDPYLETTVTDWLIHFHLSSSDRLWNYFVYEFLPNYTSFTEAELNSHVSEIFKTETPDRLQKSIKLILKIYTDSQAISKCKFLFQAQKTYSTGSTDLSNPYTIGYFLAKVWERDFGIRQSILVDEIFDAKQNLASLLGINKECLNQQLAILEKYGIIERRSARPHPAGEKPQTIEGNESVYQICRCWESAEEILGKAYENDRETPGRPLIQTLESILDNDDETPNFSEFLEWASGLVGLGGGSKTITKLAS